MPAPPIVEALEVIDQRRAGGRARRPAGVVHELDFERGEEALGHRVVPAVAAATHAAAEAVLREQGLVVAAGILGGFNWSSQQRHTGRGGDDDTMASKPVAEIVTVVSFDGGRFVETMNVLLVAPAGTVMLLGTEAILAELLERVTLRPPVGAGPLSVTVPVTYYRPSPWSG